MPQRRWVSAALVLLALATGACQRDEPRAPLADYLLGRIATRKGVCALLGDPAAAVPLARQSDLLVHALVWESDALDVARRAADAAGLWGGRLVVERGPVGPLPYADNLLDAVCSTSLSDAALARLDRAEVLRVLCPGGTAVLGRAGGGGAALTPARLRDWLGAAPAEVQENHLGLWAVFTKPFPPEADDWPLWQHGPDNNPVSRDTLIRWPYRTQYLAEPYFSAIPTVTVVSGGRVFRAAGHMTWHEREEHSLHTLYATSAFNGTLLWRRPLPEGYLVHRSMLAATPATLYLMEPSRVVLLNPATGAETGAITVPRETAPEGFWKWMTMDGDTLYALLGPDEPPEEPLRHRQSVGHWAWETISPGYQKARIPWGYGHTLVALDRQTGRVRWSWEERTPIDSRSLSVGHGRVFLHGEWRFAACLDAGTGRPLWRTEDPEVLKTISTPVDVGVGFKTSPYSLMTAGAIFLGGRGRRNVAALDPRDGRLLWSLPSAYNATNLLYLDGLLYAHVGRWDFERQQPPSCKAIEPLTGRIVRDLGIVKRNCTRMTGSPDGLFHRGSVEVGEGTTRYDPARQAVTTVRALRPPCTEGVIPAAGLLLFTPWECDCNLQLMATIALAPEKGVGDLFLEATGGGGSPFSWSRKRSPTPFSGWVTYRGDNWRSSSTQAAVPGRVALAWEHRPERPFAPSPPTAADGLVFLGAQDGKVLAIDGATGQPAWAFYTAGPVRMPPTIWQGRAYVGSADGYVYALDAASGQLLWRFRAAPVERRIMVLGALSSAWPVNTGVAVADGVAYAAAGLINYDGTHVYALDAVTGRRRWQNSTAGHLNAEARDGVSAQGDIAIVGNRLLLAGGNVASPGVFDLADGRCLNAPRPTALWPAANPGSMVAALWGRHALVGGRRLFTQDDDAISNWQPFEVFGEDLETSRARGFTGRVAPAFGHGLVAWSGRDGLRWAQDRAVETWMGLDHAGRDRPLEPEGDALPLRACVSVVVAANAVLAAGEDPDSDPRRPRWQVAAFRHRSDERLWDVRLPAPAVPNGLLIDEAGRVVVVLLDGRVICLAAAA